MPSSFPHWPSIDRRILRVVVRLLDRQVPPRRSRLRGSRHRALGEPGDKFEVVVVPDMTKDDAFAVHVKDVDAIAHTASPDEICSRPQRRTNEQAGLGFDLTVLNLLAMYVDVRDIAQARTITI
ncbi:hypothetical protein LXA43DRAFT_1060986 [Ganoderma leucocontextum]|nr:hypothetical protein LXA43DRAFT_1060978 [Ganoderma leucocontextum]KAI1791948.1 hypothetical protein LXA43DRAFT_1060986 [Ganoderma leucocontextum]